jgi:hypothetical protein
VRESGREGMGEWEEEMEVELDFYIVNCIQNDI